jgi:hypothetical protein
MKTGTVHATKPEISRRKRNPIQTEPPASPPNGEKPAETPNRSRVTSGAIFFGQFLEHFVERAARRADKI